MAQRKPELLPILKALREYIVKEYGVNYPPHVRGEDASAKDLPADWVDKLNPVTGGESVGRDTYGSAGKKSTKTATQGEDPYIHKSELKDILESFAKHVVNGRDVQQAGSRGDNAGFTYPGEGERVPQGRGLEMTHHDDEEEEEDIEKGGYLQRQDEEDEVEEPADEEEDEDEEVEDEAEEDEDEDIEKNEREGAPMQMSRDGEVGSILKDIKELMMSRQSEKRDFAELRKELQGLKKSVPNEIKNGIRNGLKGFGMERSRSDVQTRIGDEPIFASTEPSETVMPDQRIGVEGESFAKSDEEAIQEQFTDNIEKVLGSDDTNDLRSTFKRVNAMRNQSGELTPQTLYYYPRTNKKREVVS
jgi:hypothetical protein